MRVLVCGGRDFANAELVETVLNAVHASDGIDIVIHGAAPGADTLAAKWATDRSIPVKAFPANWDDGMSAGPRRNSQMLAEGKPDFVVAFPGGTGTADMVRKAKRADLNVLEVT